MVKKVWTILLGACLSLTAYAQHREVISTAGSDTTLNDMHLTYTLGEPVVAKKAVGEKYLTSGFQQSDVDVVVALEATEVIAEVKVFPNPSTEYFYVSFAGEVPENYKVVFHNVKGFFVYSRDCEGKTQRFETLDWAPGAYYMTILDPSGTRLNQFKVIKH